MQVKEIDINTGKIKEYGICNKKVQNHIFRWSYHSDLLYILSPDHQYMQLQLLYKSQKVWLCCRMEGWDGHTDKTTVDIATYEALSG